MNSHILNIEGIPGSGKSTAASQLNNLFLAAGIDSFWIREEAGGHPIGTAGLHRLNGVESLAIAYLGAWKAFVSENTRLVVLDGYALQSTVRFLFAMNAPASTLRRYFDAWQKIGENNSSIVFLKVENPEIHFRQFLFPQRGAAWCRKIASYVAATPYGKKHRLTGDEGTIEFWLRYQSTCLELLRDSVVTTRIQNYSDRSWIESHLETMKRNTG